MSQDSNDKGSPSGDEFSFFADSNPNSVDDIDKSVTSLSEIATGSITSIDSTGKKKKGKLNRINEKFKKRDQYGEKKFGRKDTVLKLIMNGKVKEFEQLCSTDPTKLRLKDTKGRYPVHWASSKGQIGILQVILTHRPEDVDLTDQFGDTPLHHAVQNEQAGAINFLISNGANANKANNRKMAPIHVAVEMNKPDILQALVSHPCVDVDQCGRHGSTALHYAAWKDCFKCAQILLDNKSSCCQKDDIGRCPLYVAALRNSFKVMEVILNQAQQAGYQRSELLAHRNQEQKTPLHAAVNGGNLQAVRMCIEGGSAIDMQQEDGSNPVHFAAAQGAAEIIRVMFQMRPNQKESSINCRDSLLMTPLHKAALFNRQTAIVVLLEEGADIEAKDGNEMTALLLAASKRAWEAVDCLLAKGADPLQKDAKNRNLLHLVIMNNGKPTDFTICFQNSATRGLLNDRDDYGCTPLHYASKEGQTSTIEALLVLGASANAKSNNMESPLHFAARYGRFHTCRRLLSFGNSSSLNETDGAGNTPVHLAALNGHTRVVHLLLQKGAGVFRDLDGNTPLHLAAQGGCVETAQALINTHSHLLNSINKDEETALHIAARYGQVNMVLLLLQEKATLFLQNKDGSSFLDIAINTMNKGVVIGVLSHGRWEEIMNMESTLYGSPMMGMIRHMPEACEVLLDRCRGVSDHDPASKEFHYTYDFSHLQYPIRYRPVRRVKGQQYIPLRALNMMVQYNRLECLSHPVCCYYLKMKWFAYGVWFHSLNLLIYLLFLASLTTFVATYAYNDLFKATETSNSTEFHMNDHEPNLQPGQKVMLTVIIVFCGLNVIKELFQIAQLKWSYFSDLWNILAWILYVTCVVYVLPFIAKTSAVSTSAQWECGAIAIFLAWFNLMLLLQRFEFFGIYVVMFLEILKTLIQVLIVFSVLIIAFGFAFFILLQSQNSRSYTSAFHSPGLSLVSTSVMMLGSIEYIENWVLPLAEGSMPFTNLSFTMLVIFIFLMPILLINLLIGLAVGDIESVQRNARLKRIAMQVQFNSEIEDRLPQKMLEWVDKKSLKVYPNHPAPHVFLKFYLWIISGGNRDHFTHFSRNETTVDQQVDPELEHQTFLYNQLNHHGKRLAKITHELSKQNDLLRLVVKKMDIKSEADDNDDADISERNILDKQQAIGWSSRYLRRTLLKQASTVQKWIHKENGEPF